MCGGVQGEGKLAPEAVMRSRLLQDAFRRMRVMVGLASNSGAPYASDGRVTNRCARAGGSWAAMACRGMCHFGATHACNPACKRPSAAGSGGQNAREAEQGRNQCYPAAKRRAWGIEAGEEKINQSMIGLMQADPALWCKGGAP